MSIWRISLLVVSLAVWLGVVAETANAGPANRNGGSGGHTQQNVPINLNGFGAPLPGVAQNSSDLNIFATGQINFKEIETLPEVGPVMNGVSCAGCHSLPAIGGGGLFINEIRVRNNTQPGPVHIFAVDNFLRNGPQTQGTARIFPQGIESEPLGCQITAPGCQLSACQEEEASKTTFSTSLITCDPSSPAFTNGGNCVTGRAALPLFGDGLVEAMADSTFQQIAQNQASAIRGTVKMVTEGFTSVAHVGRFGWKDDHASIRGFSGDAYLNEMGITNPDNQNEVSDCAINLTAYGLQLQDTGVEDPTRLGRTRRYRSLFGLHSRFGAAAKVAAKLVGAEWRPTLRQHGLRRVPHAEYDNFVEPVVVHLRDHRWNADQFFFEPNFGKPNVQSLLGLFTTRHGIAGRWNHLRCSGTDHDANRTAVGHSRQIAISPRRPSPGHTDCDHFARRTGQASVPVVRKPEYSATAGPGEFSQYAVTDCARGAPRDCGDARVAQLNSKTSCGRRQLSCRRPLSDSKDVYSRSSAKAFFTAGRSDMRRRWSLTFGKRAGSIPSPSHHPANVNRYGSQIV